MVGLVVFALHQEEFEGRVVLDEDFADGAAQMRTSTGRDVIEHHAAVAVGLGSNQDAWKGSRGRRGIRRGEHEIAVGNLLGSNIANILVVLSGTMLAAWTGADTTVLEAVEWTKWDYTAVLVASLGFFGAVARWGRIGRVGGMLMIACFFLYMGLRVYCSL